MARRRLTPRSFEEQHHSELRSFDTDIHGMDDDLITIVEPCVQLAHSETRPRDEYEALMVCAPGDEPETPVSTLLPLRDILADAIERLTPRERWVFDAVTARKQSLRQIADDLAMSKTQIGRIRDDALGKLQFLLEDNPLIKEYLSE